MPTPLGDRVRLLRKKSGLTLEGLAQRVNSGKSYIWEIENKDVARPSAEKLTLIADALDTTVHFLLHGSGEIDEEDARDEAFFRKYRQRDAPTRRRVQRFLDMLDED